MFYGINTFLAIYFMRRWNLPAAEASRATVVFLGTSIVGTLLGGLLADRFGRRAVIRTGFVGATVFLMLFLQTPERTWPWRCWSRWPVHVHADQRARRARAGVPAATAWAWPRG